MYKNARDKGQRILNYKPKYKWLRQWLDYMDKSTKQVQLSKDKKQRGICNNGLK